MSCLPHDSISTLKKHIKNPSFQHFAKEAYKAPDGYALRLNRDTGKTEMFVAGTRDRDQWLLNAWDAFMMSPANYTGIHTGKEVEWLDPWRHEKQKMYGAIANDNNVDVIYGHSRGGALVADMPLHPCTQRVGLDAAMVLASNKKMLNLTEAGTCNPTGLFDAGIGKTGKKNVSVDYSYWNPHKVWFVS